METKYVITIGRQFGSLGKDVGQLLAHKLGIQFYDKELINLASQESGLCPEFFEKADEKNSIPLLHSFATGFTFGAFQYNDFLSNDRLFQIQSDVIRKVADEHSCVIVGRCADYILRDNKNCLNIFIHADHGVRVGTAMERLSLNKEEAENYIRKMDKSRANYYNYYTDKEWGVSASYHLSVSSSVLGIERTVDFIIDYVNRFLNR